ncbi:MAG: AAA family ATPase [Dorea sp.]|nr:AAA family ATPase [Dorea sp.]
MRKEFNVTGLCVPKKHYMVDLSKRLVQMKKMIDKGNYFVINRARQYGKTTTLAALAEYLKDEYRVIFMDFQTIGNAMYENEDSFSRAFAACFLEEFQTSGKICEDKRPLAEQVIKELETVLVEQNRPFYLMNLFRYLIAVCELSDRPLVLMIDEIDSAKNNQVFLDFLSQLRNYYLRRERKGTAAFHSVILAGVYDVKNLKRKLRTDEEHKMNSPWNIAVNFDMDMSFFKDEIAKMLGEYEADENTGMNIGDMAGLIYEETSGYPFLVCRLCKIMDEELPGTAEFKNRSEAWSKEGFLAAVRILVLEKNTLFDSLNHKLGDYPELERVISRMLFNGEQVIYNPDLEEIDIAMMFGFARREGAVVVIANRIFETRLYNRFLTSEEWKESDITQASFMDKNRFVVNGHLNMRRILEKFVLHFQEIYGDKDDKFVEEYGRIFFLLYLRPIINGTGNYYVEAQTRDKKRTDVIVDYHGEQFIIEMKLWHGKEYHERGEAQLADYLNIYNKQTGYLLSFNFNKKKETGVFERKIAGKRIIEAIV